MCENTISCHISEKDTYQMLYYKTWRAEIPEEEKIQSSRILWSPSEDSLTMIAERKEGFFVDVDGRLDYRTKGKTYLVANFYIDITAYVEEISPNSTSHLIQFNLISKDNEVELEIEKEKWEKLYEQVKKQDPGLYLFSEVSRAKDWLALYLANQFSEAKRTVPVLTRYTFAGWYETEQGMRYLSGGDADCTSERILSKPSSMEEAKHLWQYAQTLLNLGNKETMLPLFLQLHVGFSMELFQKAGYPVQFVLNLIGPTGSKKTSLAKVFYCLFDIDNVMNFTATERGMELYAMRCRDAVVVLDDLNSSKDKSLAAKLNRFLRQVGDSAGRIKSTKGGREWERVDTRFAAVLTSENRLDFLQQSGRLRCLCVPISQTTIDSYKLRAVQEEQSIARYHNRPTLLEKYISAFVWHLERNYDACIDMILKYQPPACLLKFDRQAEIFRVLTCSSEMILRFGVEVKAISAKEAESLYQQWVAVLRELMKQNEYMNLTGDPVHMFTQALSQLVAEHKIRIADSKELFCQHPDVFVGFFDSTFLKVKPDFVYNAVEKFWTSLGYSFCVTANDLFTLLLEQGISEGYEQKQHKAKLLKSIKINGNKLQLLCLRRAKLEERSM